MRDSETLIDAALNTYPLAEVPRGFSGRVMAEVKALEKQTARAVNPGNNAAVNVSAAFQIDFLDIMLPFFFAFLATMIFIVLAAGVWIANPGIWLEVRTWSEIAFYRLAFVPDWTVILAIVGGAATVLAAGFLGAFWALTSWANRSIGYRI